MFRNFERILCPHLGFEGAGKPVPRNTRENLTYGSKSSYVYKRAFKGGKRESGNGYVAEHEGEDACARACE